MKVSNMKSPLSNAPIGRWFVRIGSVVPVAALATGLMLSSVGASAQDKAAMLLPGSINDQSWNASGFGATAAS